MISPMWPSRSHSSNNNFYIEELFLYVAASGCAASLLLMVLNILISIVLIRLLVFDVSAGVDSKEKSNGTIKRSGLKI